MRKLLAAALELARNGWQVFPCRADKRPYTAHGFHDASGDSDRIREWWTAYPRAGIGAAVPATLAVLDVDPRHGGPETLAGLERAYGPLPETLTCRTGGGGLHFYFLHPGGLLRQGADTLGRGLDTRMPGRGYTILPPSPHPSGRRYEWVDSTTPAAPMPPWAVARLRPRRRPVVQLPAAPIHSGRYAAKAVDGEVAAVLVAPAGGRNHQLHNSAVKLGTLVGAGLLAESEAVSALLTAAVGFIADHSERAALATIRSGLAYGMAHPRVRR